MKKKSLIAAVTAFSLVAGSSVTGVYADEGSSEVQSYYTESAEAEDGSSDQVKEGAVSESEIESGMQNQEDSAAVQDDSPEMISAAADQDTEAVSAEEKETKEEAVEAETETTDSAALAKPEEAASQPVIRISEAGTARTVSVAGVKAEVSAVNVAVWSAKNGQDDIKWYALTRQQDGSFTGTIQTDNLKHAGSCFAHFYTGEPVFVGASDFIVAEDEIPEKGVKITGEGTERTITVTAAGTAKAVNAAVWSAQNGQDDIRWYSLTRQSDGSFTGTIQISSLKHPGSCYVHVYTGDSVFVGSADFVAAADEFPKNSVQITVDDSGRKVTVTTAENAGGVKAAVWSRTNSQDDITWYELKKQGDGSWTGNIDLRKLRHSGTCFVHVYTDKNKFVGASDFELSEAERPQNKVEITGSGSSRTAVALPADSSVKGMKVAVWSAKNSQDDLKWYDLKKKADGSFAVEVNLRALKHAGSCYAHFYTNSNQFVGAASFTVDEKDFPADELVVSGTGNSRTLTVYTGSHENVTAAVWSSQNGQDDIRWYELKKQADGSWKTSVPLTNLKHPGNAVIHCYADNVSAFVGNTSFNVSKKDFDNSRDPMLAAAEKNLSRIGGTLQAAFNYSAGLTYIHMEESPSVSPSWYANYGYTTGQGNCYVMAATFYYMAKALGYDAHQVHGYVPRRTGGMANHSWVEIDVDGTPYIFDPQYTNQTGNSGYWFPYKAAGHWRYSDGVRMN